MSTTGDRQARGHARLRLGTCPDSWGVWFADDPLQTPWQRFLNEVAEVGYEWLELGPFGYLPKEAARLTEELDRRGLKVAGGTVHGFSGLHRPGDWPEIARITRQVAELTAAVGGRHVIFVPVPGYRDDKTGAFLEPAELDAGQWRTMTKATDELGKIVSQEHGLRLEFHPHADSHVETQSQTERFLEQTDPRYVSLCLDTGHLAYRHADNVALIGRYPDRIGYVHIKQMDPAIVARADREGLAFGQAVAMGASCEPPSGEPAIADVAKALRELDRDLFVVVEQDMYPTDFDKPKPIAQRTYYLPARRRHREGVTMTAWPGGTTPQSPRTGGSAPRTPDPPRPGWRHRRRHDRPGPHPPDHPGPHRRRRGRRQRRRRGPGRPGGGGPVRGDRARDSRRSHRGRQRGRGTGRVLGRGPRGAGRRGDRALASRCSARNRSRRPATPACGSWTPRWRPAVGASRSASCAATTRATRP